MTEHCEKQRRITTEKFPSFTFNLEVLVRHVKLMYHLRVVLTDTFRLSFWVFPTHLSHWSYIDGNPILI